MGSPAEVENRGRSFMRRHMGTYRTDKLWCVCVGGADSPGHIKLINSSNLGVIKLESKLSLVGSLNPRLFSLLDRKVVGFFFLLF